MSREWVVLVCAAFAINASMWLMGMDTLRWLGIESAVVGSIVYMAWRMRG